MCNNTFCQFLVLPTFLPTSSRLARHVAICSQATVVSIREQSYDNWFYEIELSKLQGAYLQAKDAGVGVVVQAKGTIKFQVSTHGQLPICQTARYVL